MYSTLKWVLLGDLFSHMLLGKGVQFYQIITHSTLHCSLVIQKEEIVLILDDDAERTIQY